MNSQNLKFAAIRSFCFLIVFGCGALIGGNSVARAEEQDSRCQGFLYKAKKDGVPVYLEADRASEVLLTLKIGEKVCYIGEQGEFVIVDWLRTALVNKETRAKTHSGLVYVRTVELWPTDEMGNGERKKQGGLLDSLRESYYYWKSGGVPEQGIVPYRPAVDAMSESVTKGADQPNGEDKNSQK